MAAKKQYPKTCEKCESDFLGWHRTARFCSQACKADWQRGRRQPLSEIRFCANERCQRTFWGKGRQRYCRKPRCQGQRLIQRMASVYPGLQEEIDARLLELELPRLINDQEYEMIFESRRVERSYSEVSLEVMGGELDFTQVLQAPSDSPLENMPW